MERLENEKVVIKEDMYKETLIGIFADESGYGKSRSIVGLIARNKMEWDLETPFVSDKITTKSAGKIKHHCIHKFDKLPTTVILVSPSILKQWEGEFNETTIPYLSISSLKHIDNYNPSVHEVIIVVPSMYNELMRTYPSVAWKRFVFDEPGHVKVPAMKPINAGFYWFVSATPKLIVSNHKSCRTSFMRDIVGERPSERLVTSACWREVCAEAIAARRRSDSDATFCLTSDS